MKLLVRVDGTKRWLFRYQFDGKPNQLGFGTYPDTTLENARRKAEEARQQTAEGINPSGIKKQIKATKQLAELNQERINEGLPVLDSFAYVTRQWLDSISHLTKARTHTQKTSRIERLAFPIQFWVISQLGIGLTH